MAHNILAKIHRNKPSAPVDSMMSEIRGEVRASYKEVDQANMARDSAVRAAQSATSEAAIARAEAAQFQSERDASQRLLESSNATVESLRKQISDLRVQVKAMASQITLEQGTLKDNDTKLTLEVKGAEQRASAAEKRAHQLELELAKKDKPTKMMAQAVPEFTIDNVVRGGPENRIVSATIKPRLN